MKNEALNAVRVMVQTIMQRDSLETENTSLLEDLRALHMDNMRKDATIEGVKAVIEEARGLNYSIFDFEKVESTGAYMCRAGTDISGEYVRRADILLMLERAENKG